jgi:hypothetical protein
MNSSIDWDQPVQTRNGHSVRILANDLEGDEPVIGVITDSTATQRWRCDGSYLPDGTEHSLDLINVPKTPFFGPDDIGPGTRFRLKRERTTILWPMWVSPWGMCFGDGVTQDWQGVRCHYEVQFPDEEEWGPCENPF